MNIVRLMGGIGNQLFQYSFGLVLESTGRDVAYDMSWYVSKGATHEAWPRPLRLDKFQIEDLKIHSFIPTNPMVYEHKVGFDMGLFGLKTDCNFEGYWQYYDYYRQVVPALQQIFQLRTEVYTEEFLKYAEQIWSGGSVSIHIRRGDYQKHRKGAFRDLPAQYYFSAIREVEGDLFIFSDDIPWCKETFKQAYYTRKITFVDVEDYLALELMRYCKHNIITNSTFSWWAALLNQNEGKKVFCPVHYLGDSEEDSIRLRYPQEWIKLKDYATHIV